MEAIIAGPAGSPYEGGSFRLHVQIPPDYPFRRVEVEDLRLRDVRSDQMWKDGRSKSVERASELRMVSIATCRSCSVTAAQLHPKKGIVVAPFWNVAGLETCVLAKDRSYV